MIFFQDIYTKPAYVSSSRDSILDFLSSEGDDHIIDQYLKRALTSEEKDSLETALSKAELKEQLFNHMKPNSSPRIDGFTVINWKTSETGQYGMSLRAIKN